MALKLRFRRMGRRNSAKYRLVVADERSPRDGRFVEELGYYDPAQTEEEKVVLKKERVEYWIGQGALISESVRPHLKRIGVELR